MTQESKRPENAGVEEDVRTEGGEGARKSEATPKIGEDAEPGKTTQPAPPDDAQRTEEGQ
jgi:hypothetical protein